MREAPESEGPGTRSSNVPEQAEMDVQLKSLREGSLLCSVLIQMLISSGNTQK